MNITALSIRRPSLIIVVLAVLMFMGVASYRNLPIELVPKFNPPVVTITAIYPGASPAEIENAVSKPIEDVVSSLEGIEQIQIGSMENSCFIALEMNQSVDVDEAVPEIQRKINQILPTLPKEVRPPVVNNLRKKRSTSSLSNKPVGSNAPNLPSESASFVENGFLIIDIATARNTRGTCARRWANSPNAGFKKIPG